MSTLRNLKHELLAQSLILYKGNRSKAYRSIYETCNPTSARACSSRLLSTNANILSRSSELLSVNKPIIERISESLTKQLESNNGRLQLIAVKVLLKLYGVRV